MKGPIVMRWNSLEDGWAIREAILPHDPMPLFEVQERFFPEWKVDGRRCDCPQLHAGLWYVRSHRDLYTFNFAPCRPYGLLALVDREAPHHFEVAYANLAFGRHRDRRHLETINGQQEDLAFIEQQLDKPTAQRSVIISRLVESALMLMMEAT